MYSFDRFAMAKLAEAFWMDAQVFIKNNITAMHSYTSLIFTSTGGWISLVLKKIYPLTTLLSTPFQLIANAEFLISQSQGSKSKHLGMYT